jgi:hypothetical protein
MTTHPATRWLGALAVATSCSLLIVSAGVMAVPPVDDPCGDTFKVCDLAAAPTVAADPSAPAVSLQATESSAAALGWSPLAGVYADATPRVLPNGNLVVQVADDGAPYVHVRNVGGWSGPLAAGGLFNSTVTPAAALNQLQPATVELFGVGLDDAMWYRTGSTGWQSLGGAFIADPVAVVFGGVTYVFGVGRDNAVWYRSLSSGWISLGGYVTSDVALTTDGSSMYVLARGGDGALWTRQLAGSTWLPWQYLGGVIISYPSTAFLANAGYVFVIGADNAVWYQRVQAGSWSGWQGLGGIALSAPAAAEDPNGGVDVFVVGADLAMYSRRLTAAGWSPWQGLGGGFRSAPGAGGNQVFGIGLDGWLYAATFI